MPTHRVRSTNGADGDGLTWATARISTNVITFAAGDTALLSQNHSQDYSSNTAYVINTAGTLANPTKIICANDSSENPTDTAATAVISTSGTGHTSTTINGSCYVEGVNFTFGTGYTFAYGVNLSNTANQTQTYRKCQFVIAATGSTSKINIGQADRSLVKWFDVGVRFGAAGNMLQLTSGRFEWIGGSLLSGGVSPTSLFNVSSVGSVRGGAVVMADVDLSAAAAGINLVAAGASGPYTFHFSNIRLPASWTGKALVGGSTESNQRVEAYNLISGTTKIYQIVDDTYGAAKSTSAIYRVGGAMIGTDPVSIRLEVYSNVRYPTTRFESNWIYRAFPGPSAEDSAFVAGTTKTVSVDFVRDDNVAAGQGAGVGRAFQNTDFILEVESLDTTGTVVGTVRSSAPGVLAVPTDIPASTETFVTTGLTTPVRHRLSVQITPREKGTLRARIIGAAAGKVIHYCPELMVA